MRNLFGNKRAFFALVFIIGAVLAIILSFALPGKRTYLKPKKIGPYNSLPALIMNYKMPEEPKATIFTPIAFYLKDSKGKTGNFNAGESISIEVGRYIIKNGKPIQKDGYYYTHNFSGLPDIWSFSLPIVKPAKAGIVEEKIVFAEADEIYIAWITNNTTNYDIIPEGVGLMSATMFSKIPSYLECPEIGDPAAYDKWAKGLIDKLWVGAPSNWVTENGGIMMYFIPCFNNNNKPIIICIDVYAKE